MRETDRAPVRFEDDVAVVSLFGAFGAILGSYTPEQIRAAIAFGMDQGCVKIALDIKEARYVDSITLSELLRFSAFVHRRNPEAQIKFLKLHPRLRKLLEVTRAIEFFDQDANWGKTT